VAWCLALGETFLGMNNYDNARGLESTRCVNVTDDVQFLNRMVLFCW
jgi:hypothetical protein